MPTLNWIGKDRIINHHQEVPFRTLEKQYSFCPPSQQEKGLGGSTLRDEVSEVSKIIQGDNLEALKALLPQYENRVKCIYIDPPYNTGNEVWVYNDNVNDPRLKKWLGQVVGKEAEDLSRHDKWLCMMYPRLKLLHKLLADDGAIFISIDDNEQANLKLIMDEIFGARNFVANVIWQKSKKGDSKLIAVIHEYVFIYAKNKSVLLDSGIWRQKKEGVDEILDYYNSLRKIYGNDHEAISKEMAKWYNLLPKEDLKKAQKHYRISDDRGLYFPDNFAGPNDGRDSRPRYEIYHPITGKSCKKPSTGWRWEESKTKAALELIPPRIHFGIDENTIPCRKSYLFEIDSQPFSSVFYADGRGATRIVDDILGKNSFDFPKTPSVLEDFFELFVGKNDIILDSFAGSGTTAHAVLNLNKADGGNRQFILIEMNDYAETITAERVRRVINGYGNTEGTGGSFDFYTLGEALFDEQGNLNANAKIEAIREYIWFTETRSSFVANRSSNNESGTPPEQTSFLGTHNGTDYYFCYDPNEAVILDMSLLSTITQKAAQYLIYADSCELSEEFLNANNIIFKKIPRDITRL